MTTAIIVLHYGNTADTIACLKSLRNLKNTKAVTVYLVDNGTNQIRSRMIEGFPIKIKLIRNEHNLGYAGGNNKGIKKALEENHDYILLLNNDAVVAPDLLESLLPIIKRREVGAVGCIITYAASKKIWFAGGTLNTRFCLTRHKDMNKSLTAQHYTPEASSDFITGAALLTKREVIKKIGLLPEDYFLYWEDVDFCHRVWEAGYSCIVVNKPLVKHNVSASAGYKGSNKLSPLRAYFYARNPFIFMRRNSLSLLTGLLGQIFIRLPYSFLLFHSFASFRSYINGLIDGARIIFNSKAYNKKIYV